MCTQCIVGNMCQHVCLTVLKENMNRCHPDDGQTLKAVSVRKCRECLCRQVKHITNISSNLLHNFRASVNILRSIKIKFL